MSTQGWRGKYGTRYARAFGPDSQTAVSVIQHGAWMENVSMTTTSKRQQLHPLSAENWISPYFQAETRQMILSAVLTDYIHATVKSPGSCCWCCFFKFCDTREELKVFLQYNYWHALIWDCDIRWCEVVTADGCDATAAGVLGHGPGSFYKYPLTEGDSLNGEIVFQLNISSGEHHVYT